MRLLKNRSKMVQRANVASNSKWSSRKNIPYIASDSWVLRCNLLMRVNGFQSALCVILQYMDTGGKNRYPGVLLVGVFRFAKDTLHVMLEPRWCGAAGAEEGLCKRSQTQQPYPRPSYTIPTSPSRRADSQEMRAS